MVGETYKECKKKKKKSNLHVILQLVWPGVPLVLQVIKFQGTLQGGCYLWPAQPKARELAKYAHLEDELKQCQNKCHRFSPH